jgi:hypothetical protein
VFVERVGLDRAAWLSATAVVFGVAVYGLLSSFGYVWVGIALVLVAAGMRVVGVVAGVNVLRGLPKNRTTIGAALVDTATEVTSGVGSPSPAPSLRRYSPATSQHRTGARSKPRNSRRQ